MKRISALLLGLMLIVSASFAQGGGNNNNNNPGGGNQTPQAPASNPGNGRAPNKYLEYNYTKLNVKERKVVPYPSLRQADVMFARRISRVIDSREKKNQVMNWPKNPLNAMIYRLAASGEKNSQGQLKAYANDSLDRIMSTDKIKQLTQKCISTQIPNPANPDDPYDLVDTTICSPFEPEQIVRWQINEEWIFDKQRSTFFPRIIGIAPLFVLTTPDGTEIGEIPLFWISYAELRHVLVNEEIFTRGNDGMMMTYYDFFENRIFSSYITKESNDRDLAIKDQEQFKDDPMEALYENDRIRNNLLNYEHDLWEY